MARKRVAQDALPLAGVPRYRPGTIEKAVTADVKTMRELEILSPAVDSLAHACRLVARELDRAEREGDRWGKLAAARELRSLRAQIGSLAPLPVDDGFDEQVDRLTTAFRDAPPT